MYYEIVRSGVQYLWRIRGGNHEIVASSERLTSRAACLNAINLVKRGGGSAPIRDAT